LLRQILIAPLGYSQCRKLKGI